MRRLWAYILIACSALIAVFASFPSTIKGITSNGDHETRRQFTFQLSERKAIEGEAAPKKLDKNSANDMAKIMEQRLIQYGITSYDISVSGTKLSSDATNKESEISDIVTVSFTADDKDQYSQIATYLTFSGSFALMNNQTDVLTAKQFRNGDAYKKNVSVNEFPTVILPIKTDDEGWAPLVKGAIDNPFTEEAQEEGGESTSVARIFLIYNYEEGDTYEILQENNKLNEKTLLTFDFDPSEEKDDGLYYDANKNSLAKTCYYSDTNGNGIADPNEVKSAFNQADYLLNLFNASALDYEVECIRGLSGSEVWLAPAVEKIFEDGNIAWNATLTAAIAAVVIVSLLLVVFYRLGALSAVTTTIVTTFGALLFMVTAGLEYNTLAVVGLITVAIVSLLSNIIYLNKLKEDAYRGHTLKKANTEASKKSLLPIIDINIVGLVIGLMCYLLGGSALHSFGSILTFGTLISLVVNTLGLKGLMWLSTNATGLIGKYELFGINSENVPNHMQEEKQRYFGPYADKDLSSKKKPVSIAALAGLVVATAGIILGSVFSSGNLLKQPVNKVTANEIYIQNTIKVVGEDSKSELDETTLMSILDDITVEVNVNGANEYKPLSDEYFITKNISYVNYSTTDSETDDGGHVINYLTTYYVVKLNKALTNIDKLNAKIVSDATFNGSLDEALKTYFETTSTFSSSVENSITIKQSVTVTKFASPDWTKIVLASSIAVLILTLYLTIRYRLSRGLATLVFPVVSGIIVLGILGLVSLIGLSLPASTVIALPITALFSYAFMILFMNREREMVLDDKTRDTSIEHRVELSKKAMGMAFTPVLASAVIGLYLLIDFFGFGVASASYLYLTAIFGGLLALGLVAVLYVPAANLLYKLFSNVNFNIKPREKKNKKVATKKSAEPEEAIFIGIND